MKNQYVGDIGDYGKYALLRSLIAKGYSMGVNWYLTPNDDKTDGKFIDYLKKESDSLDEKLFRKLKDLFITDDNKNRNITTVEESGILNNTVFFNEILNYENITNRKEYRNDWINRSIDILGEQDIIFLDPDNGLEIKSVPPTRKNGNKYVTYEEAARYYELAKVALVIYNHRDRSPESKYIERFLKFYAHEGTKSCFLHRLTFHRISVRDYIFLIKNPDYYMDIYDLANSFAKKSNDYFTVGRLPMPLVKRWALDGAPTVMTPEEYEQTQKEYNEKLQAWKKGKIKD